MGKIIIAIITIIIIIIIIFMPSGLQIPRAKNKKLKQISWWLEVQVFVVGTEGLVNEDRVEAVNQNRQTLEQERGLTSIAGNDTYLNHRPTSHKKSYPKEFNDPSVSNATGRKM